jgi:hypothetical protein
VATDEVKIFEKIKINSSSVRLVPVGEAVSATGGFASVAVLAES